MKEDKNDPYDISLSFCYAIVRHDNTFAIYVKTIQKNGDILLCYYNEDGTFDGVKEYSNLQDLFFDLRKIIDKRVTNYLSSSLRENIEYDEQIKNENRREIKKDWDKAYEN